MFTVKASGAIKQMYSTYNVILQIPYGGKVWRVNSFQAFGERKFGELINQPIDY